MIEINGRGIGDGCPVYIVCEISANHCQKFEYAVELIKTAKSVGADAVKVQLYTPDSMTLPIEAETGDFYINSGLHKGTSLWNLYSHTHMPWSWYPELLELAENIGITLFPTVYDLTALEYAGRYATPAYKIASFEIGDRTLLRRVAETKKPTFISTGCATEDDYFFIVGIFDYEQCLLLHCTSEYPAIARESDIEDSFRPGNYHEFSGISDHTVGIGLPVLCAINGAHAIEKHIWLGRGDCADREFSLNPTEFKTMVDVIRAIEVTKSEMGKFVPRMKPSSSFQRSIYAVQDIKKDDVLTTINIRLVRPGYGLDPRKYEDVLGKTATMDIPYGTALKENYYK